MLKHENYLSAVCHMKIKKSPFGVLHSFSIKNIFYDKIYLWLFYFRVTNCTHSTTANYTYQIRSHDKSK